MSKKMDTDTNALNWFEIPAKDIERAKKFYEAIFDIKMETMDMNGMKMAMFPFSPEGGKISGALVQSQFHTPSATGAIIYLNGNPDLQQVLDRMEKAGGKVNMPKTLIKEEIGYMAFFSDSEGNTVGLHSNK